MSWKLPSRRGVLIGLVLVLLAFVAAVLVPNLYVARQRSHQKRTMADQRSIATALEAWGTDHGPYPTLATIDALRPFLEPTYIRSLPRHDGWGNPYGVRSSGHAYIIASAGSDGKFNVDYVAVAATSKPGRIKSFNEDLVYANGGFFRYPEGI